MKVNVTFEENGITITSQASVYMFGIGVDDNGFLFPVTKLGNKGKSLLKFNHEIDFEDIKVPSTTWIPFNGEYGF